MILAAGADAGESAAWALVEARRGARPRLVLLAEVYGEAWPAWEGRALDGARAIVAAAGGPVPCAIEVPVAKIRGRAGLRHHRSSGGLGQRIGALRMAWRVAAGAPAREVQPGAKGWWGPFGLRAKTRWEFPGKPPPGWIDGWERVAEAGMLVEGARERLELVPKTRRVDCAEAVLIAAAEALRAIT